jgi:hypothetical protein
VAPQNNTRGEPTSKTISFSPIWNISAKTVFWV